MTDIHFRSSECLSQCCIEFGAAAGCLDRVRSTVDVVVGIAAVAVDDCCIVVDRAHSAVDCSLWYCIVQHDDHLSHLFSVSVSVDLVVHCFVFQCVVAS